MKATLTLMRRELASLFYSPIGYVVLALFALGSSMVVYIGFAPGNHATMRITYSGVVWLLIFLAPAISMRLVSEELSRGTIERLMTSPGNDLQIILGKWLAATGPRPVDEYLFRFLEAEMRAQPRPTVEGLQPQIASLLSLVMEKGMPFRGDRKSNKEENRLSRNAEEALLVMLHLCTKISGRRVTIDFPTPYDFGAWVSKLQPQRKGGENTIAYWCFS